MLDIDTPSDFARAYPMPGEWLILLICGMDAVASVHRLAASKSPGIDGLRSRFDALITLQDGRSFGVLCQGMTLLRRSLCAPVPGRA